MAGRQLGKKNQTGRVELKTSRQVGLKTSRLQLEIKARRQVGLKARRHVGLKANRQVGLKENRQVGLKASRLEKVQIRYTGRIKRQVHRWQVDKYAEGGRWIG